MAKGFVVSDLHIFARRSTASNFLPLIQDAMLRSEVCVLNGDIFDFRWSTLASLDQSVAAARDWLSRHLTTFPECQFHYLPGNHDSGLAFLALLEELQSAHRNFTIHNDFLQLGDRLFIHGDVIHARGNFEKYRSAFDNDRTMGPLANLLYDCLTISRLSALHASTISKSGAVRKVVSHLQQRAPEALRQARHIYFGHTHAPFENYQFEQWLFHNTGATIRGMKFKPLEFPL